MMYTDEIEKAMHEKMCLKAKTIVSQFEWLNFQEYCNEHLIISSDIQDVIEIIDEWIADRCDKCAHCGEYHLLTDMICPDNTEDSFCDNDCYTSHINK